MIQILRALIQQGLEKQVSATGLGLFRIFFGLVIFQEIIFLMFFRHLIFDAVPFIDMASPVLHLFLGLWAIVALCLVLGYRCRLAALINYILWIVFVGFTPMWRDFDGGFDQFMIGCGFVLIFLPIDRSLSLDNLQQKLSKPWSKPSEAKTVSVLCYTLPLAFGLGLLYLDAGIHKLSAEFWRNGMGSWLPPTMPYYMSAIDMSWLLNNKLAEQLIGYTLIAFQFAFLPLFWFARFRVPLLIIGVLFHAGIVLSLNIYPFGFGMLSQYVLLVPFSWWRNLGAKLQCQSPVLKVFFDAQCPLCNRTVIILNHFDAFKSVEFLSLQTEARKYPELDSIHDEHLLKDIYALDQKGRLCAGLDTYIKIMKAMIYLWPLALISSIPGIYHLGKSFYRRIADQRQRCSDRCEIKTAEYRPFSWGFDHYTNKQRSLKIAKLAVILLLLQLNSTIHFGIFYRINQGHAQSEAGQTLEAISDAILLMSHSFLGITPHALYMHDHFKGYNHILAITYQDKDGQEKWLPFVNEEGRIVAPNWGRVQCWWANVAVTSKINRKRLDKALMQVTAFWGTQIGLDLEKTRFNIKMKEVRVPMDWEKDLREHNVQQPWKNIGTLSWKDEKTIIDLKEIDLESL